MPNTIHVAPPKRSKATKPRAAKNLPTQEEIQLRAYDIYVERYGAPGNALEDWAQAERELLQKPRKARKSRKTIAV